LRRTINPLFIVGPPGTGKSHLANALANQIARESLELVVTILAARDLGHEQATEDNADLHAAGQADLLVIEDVHLLRETATETLVQLLDERVSRQLQTLFTAVAGPARLERLPRRLTSRLAAVLVVEIDLFARPSRLAFLQDRASRRQLAIGTEVIEWLAENVGGSPRQLEGAISRVETLAKVHRRVPNLELVAAHFGPEAEASRPSMERILLRVSNYFRVAPEQLQSRRRYRNALLPRQVGMYLARQLTALSLEQIGAHFGGRDHSTVLHACRKVEVESQRDLTLSGALRQLQADLVQ